MFAVACFLDGREGRIGVDVACASAVPQFLDTVANVRIFMFLVWIPLEVAHMATGTVGSEVGTGILNGLAVVPVAGQATHVTPMVTGIGAGLMVIIDRRPSRGIVTDVTFLYGTEMVARLAHGEVAVVATAASATDTLVVESTADESRRGMAVAAVQRCRNVVGRHAGRGNTVTGGAVVDDAGVIEGCRRKGVGIMANTAVLDRLHVIDRFTLRKYIVVAGFAIVDDADVIERRRDESRGQVAGHAVIIGRYVVKMFAGGGSAVVTGCTVASDALVVEPGTGKLGRVVTQRTILGRRYRDVGGSQPSGRNAIVTAGTIVDDALVIENGAGETARQVAGTTVLRGRQVTDIHSDCGHVIVTGIAAATDDIRTVVIDVGRRKRAGIVTTAAVTGRRNMVGR